MSKESQTEQVAQPSSEFKLFPATVVAINDQYTVVINRGSIHGIKKGHVFLIYGLSEKEIIDPESGENLGLLEIVRGTGEVVHVQEKLATIESNRRSKNKRTIRRRAPWSIGMDETETVDNEGTMMPFEDPKIGDKARLV